MKTSILLPHIVFLAASLITIDASCQRPQQQFAEVYSPDIPTSMTFCGNKIDFDRVDMYERLDRELSSVVYTHGTTMLIIKRANRYFPEMAPILRANGVPDDLLYLACVESSLNPRAYSPAKAAGFWQFIESAAKEYGLEVNNEVDERYNIEKATAAAAKFLKKAYNKYGDWSTAMAAYNGGLTRVAKALSTQGVKTSLDLYLTEETTRYPYRVMAMKIIMENPAKYGFRLRDDQLYQPRKYRVVEVKGAVEDWAAWAKKQGITYSELREENMWIRSNSLTNKSGKTYKVRIPVADSLLRKKAGTKTYNQNWTVR